ncbi:MAG: M23 family metallopeptidase [Candidatus Sumerlaeia bacterium]
MKHNQSIVWLFALPLLLLAAVPSRAISTAPASSNAPALADDPNSSLRSNLLARIEFQELNLQLAGIATIGGATTCYIKHPGSGQPMSYHVGDVIGGYRIQSVQDQSVCFERNGLRFWLQPEKPMLAAKTQEQPAAVDAKARQALMQELETAKAIKESVETISANNLKLKSRTKRYAKVRVIDDQPGRTTVRRVRTGGSAGRMFALPMTGELSSQYGYRRHPMGGGVKFHRGVDIANREGTLVGAAAAGTVTKVSYNSSYGRHIVVTHGGGYETLYGHLSRTLVKVGQEVDQGQVVGREGDTGRSTGPHLHFEIRKNGQSVDPEAYVRVHR